MDSWEATANTALGCAINWTVLVGVYGQPVTASTVTIAMIGLTWVRTRSIRWAFRRMEVRHA